MTGKEKCNYLKQLRNSIAKKNNIEYVSEECRFKGNCKGTCPKCEAELKELTKKINDKKKIILGLGIGAATLGLVGCVNTPDHIPTESSAVSSEGETREIQLENEVEGDIELVETDKENIEISGNVEMVIPDDGTNESSCTIEVIDTEEESNEEEAESERVLQGDIKYTKPSLINIIEDIFD